VKLSQAKAIAGITASISGRAGLEAAMKRIKSLIVEARKAGDDARAAKLSEAKEYFRRRLTGHNSCQTCGKPIGASATYCQLHSRPAVLPAHEAVAGRTWINSHGNLITDPPNSPKSPMSKPASPKGGSLARLGYYTPAVQKAVAKWAPIVGGELLDGYFRATAKSVVLGEQLALPFVPQSHWPAIWALGKALSAVYDRTSKAPAWLLRLPLGALKNGEAHSWNDLRGEIKRRGGRRFSRAEIVGAATRMRLLNKPTA
jgi:hypothetical protein